MPNWNVDQPAPKALWQIIHSHFPDKTRSLGISMPPGHEDHSEGRALDVGIRAWIPQEKKLAEKIVEALVDHSSEVNWSYFISFGTSRLPTAMPEADPNPTLERM
jgi:hypothetical protein